MNANEIEAKLAAAMGIAAPDEHAHDDRSKWRGNGLYAELSFEVIGAAIEVINFNVPMLKHGVRRVIR